ncbi:CHAT domain-containing protein [Synechococcus sp. EJ6-Ellesmere]|uniref:CHAT domain-containing protein n=1 Tax=Synechococcus sp. EJ6-Ellesmere TaxID=2823734 RepID=UPI0020CE8EA2|nr:CHAT domain-containing protein [Synechococcus sp. EJ6-Ellesmere]MCP9826685.1 CHAT domain-containing protein [Synechococcus sp. EJ6-Ellesmere]
MRRPSRHRRSRFLAALLPLLLGLSVAPPAAYAVPPSHSKTLPPPISNGASSFDAALYNPAILRISLSEAKGKTANPQADAFLDLTLVPPEGEVQGYRSEMSLKRFNELLRELYRQLASQSQLNVSDLSSPARQLYSILFQPVVEQIEKQRITTLLISADAGLQAVPFAALHDGQTYLGERYGLGLTPALGLTKLAVLPEKAKPQLLAVGASKFVGLNPLPLVPQELDRVGRGESTQLFLNRSFTPEILLEKAGDPLTDRVHVATHAEFLPGGAAAARLYSGTGPMSLAQLAQLRQRRGDTQLDLFSLSACRTALGDADSELGFAGLALQAASRSAIGSLWYVDDVATSALFVQFYRFLYRGIPNAEALQYSRPAMPSGTMRLVGDQVIGSGGDVLLSGLTMAQQRRIDGGLQNPFFWAGIVLLGTPW